MKRFITFLLMMALVMPMAVAQNKLLEKAQKKEYKAKIKEFKKEGWKLYGSSRTIEVALLTHYDKLQQLGDNGYEVMGEASSFKSKNVGKQMAINNACNIYARNAGSHVKGRVVSDLAGDANNTDAEFEHFYAAYETLVEKEIKGEMQESFSVIKDNKNGTYSMQTYFIINEDAAVKARIRAMENAMKESQAAQKYAKNVSDFVREGFEGENNSGEQ